MKAVPFLTVLLLLALMYMVSGTLTRSEGMILELPQESLGEGATTDLVAVMQPVPGGALVFFDDARYDLGDLHQRELLGEAFASRTKSGTSRTLLVLADAQVTLGELTSVAAVAKTHGITRLFLANRRAKEVE